MKSHNSSVPPVVDTNNRLTLDDSFCFECGPHVECFTECCGKLDLRLTPYDVLRLRRGLGRSSGEFLDVYTIIRWRTPHGLPEVMMKMDRDAGRRCPFVTEQGCMVYENRPGACRIYPIGRAATKNPVDGSREEFYFPVREQHCKGFGYDKQWTVREWLDDQELDRYNRFNDMLMEIYVMKSRRRDIELSTKHMQMFMMALYSLDRFREFLFKSGFLQKFDLEPELVDALKNDDYRLLEFAFQWLRFAFFGEPTLTVKAEVARKFGAEST